MAVYISLITADLNLSGSRSLKEKRAAMRPMKDRLRSCFNVSVIENDHQDDKTRGSLLIAGIAYGRRGADSIASSIINFIESNFGDLDISIEENVIQLD
jgi:uncharacterized protein YlxP (DUF503 family)